jgi:hypothetical protein
MGEIPQNTHRNQKGVFLWLRNYLNFGAVNGQIATTPLGPQIWREAK